MTTRVLITGASSGLGHDAALALARRGHTVFASMRAPQGKNSEQAATLEHLARQERLDLHVLDLDVTDDVSIGRAMATVTAEGGLDVLVNNAGIGVMGVQETITSAQAQGLFEVNVLGVHRMNRAVLPVMRRQGHGLIIYMSATVGRLVMPFAGLYSASKFALEALAEAASYELAPLGIRTLIIEPGAYATDFGANLQLGTDTARQAGYGPVGEAFTRFLGRVSSQPLGQPSEVTEAIIQAVEGMGAQPLRQPVGTAPQPSVPALNHTIAQAQAGWLAALGME